MTTFDLSPLYRSTIGFDRMARLLDHAARSESQSFPPYNIEAVEEDQYRITMAVAGFGEEDLNIVSEQNKLVIEGRKESKDDEERRFLHRGIAERSFERRFQLADHVKVTGARLDKGLLHIELVREVPEAMKPHKIQIESSEGRMIEGEREAA